MRKGGRKKDAEGEVKRVGKGSYFNFRTNFATNKGGVGDKIALQEPKEDD